MQTKLTSVAIGLIAIFAYALLCGIEWGLQ